MNFRILKTTVAAATVPAVVVVLEMETAMAKAVRGLFLRPLNSLKSSYLFRTQLHLVKKRCCSRLLAKATIMTSFS